MQSAQAGGTLDFVAPWFRVLGLSALAASCGPSLETMHASNLRFEHCYRLDMDPKIAPTHREHCWYEWTEEYAYGQALDRVEYARRRIVELQSGDTRLVTLGDRPQSQGRVFAEVGASPDAPMAAPAPTSAHAPPPATEPVAPPPPEPAPAGSGRPGDGCADECGRVLRECTELCDAKQADCAVCREDYRRCMRRCFE